MNEWKTRTKWYTFYLDLIDYWNNEQKPSKSSKAFFEPSEFEHNSFERFRVQAISSSQIFK